MTEQELNDLSIFALRELARSTGVHSPTSKRKDELIKGILDITEGRVKPQATTSKQGRPPKNHGYAFAELVLQGKNNETNNRFTTNLTLNQEVLFTNGENDSLNGIVEIVNNTTAYLCVRGEFGFNRVNIPFAFVHEYGLKDGDYIFVKLDTVNKIITDILNINNCPAKRYKPLERGYADFKHAFLNKNIMFTEEELNKFDIKLGESVYLYGANNNANTEAIIRLLNSAIADKKIYVNTSVADKNIGLLDKIENAELFTARFTDNLDTARRIVKLATERAKRLMEQGENVIIAIDDVLSVAGVDTQDLPITKGLVSLTKATTDAGTISVFAIISSDRGCSLFEKLADKRIKVVDHQLFIMD